jgi:hypothetical protein
MAITRFITAKCSFVYWRKVAVLALFADTSFVAGGKERGFCRLRERVATPELSRSKRVRRC